VAIKVLKPELAAVLGAERFLQEITTTAQLQHPNILPLFDSGAARVAGQASSDEPSTLDPRPATALFYVMPFIEGETLRARLDRETQLGVADAVRLTAEVADALQYAHAHGIVHRDIKPENILLHAGRPMVADFGIALAVSAAAGGRMTETGMSLGTPHYMSPEQATAEKEITPRSDIYSLGSVLYEMLTGTPPHTGASAQQIIMKIVTEEAAPVTRWRKAVPAHVAAAVGQALEKLPADRFESAKAFAEALQNPGFTSTRSAGLATAPAARLADRRWQVIAAAAVVVAGAALAYPHRAAPAPATEPMRFALTSPHDGVEPVNATISDDGRTVVFVGQSSGGTQLYRRSVDDLEVEPLAGTDGAFEPAISPDGRWIAFFARDATVRKMPIDGGPSTLVVPTTMPAGIAWSAKATLVLGMPGYSTTVSGLSTVNAMGDSMLHPLTRPDDSMHHWPYVIPSSGALAWSVLGRRSIELGVSGLDGRNARSFDLPAATIVGVADGVLLYQRAGDQRLMAVAFDAKRLRPVGDPVTVNGIPADMTRARMAPNGTLVMLRRSESYQIVLVDDHGTAEVILPDTISDFVPRYSPSGTSAALVADFRGQHGVWTLDFGNRTLTRLWGGDRASSVVWTPDGRRVLTASIGAPGVTWQAADGRDSAVTLIADPSAPMTSAVISPDGRTLAVGTAFGANGFDVVTRPLHGDTALRPFAATRANEVAPACAPDGRWLAYASDESGRYEIYIRAFPGPGPLVQVSDSGGTEPVWDRDGRRIYFRNGRAMMRADVAPDANGTLRVTARHHLFDGDFATSGPWSAAAFDVAADGRHFLMARAVAGGHSELVMWTNWLGAVHQQLGQ
jgi:serine/threonine-protein kinase